MSLKPKTTVFILSILLQFLSVSALATTISPFDKAEKAEWSPEQTIEITDIECDGFLGSRGQRSTTDTHYYKVKPSCMLSEEIQSQFECFEIIGSEFLPKIKSLRHLKLDTSKQGHMFINPYSINSGIGMWPTPQDFENDLQTIEKIIVHISPSDQCEFIGM